MVISRKTLFGIIILEIIILGINALLMMRFSPLISLVILSTLMAFGLLNYSLTAEWNLIYEIAHDIFFPLGVTFMAAAPLQYHVNEGSYWVYAISGLVLIVIAAIGRIRKQEHRSPFITY